ncbi:DNA polymerase III PolC-type-like [Dicentrarchus labrax]|uniref:DNA polymerase III PolC-type-like n=1 Tax=Dicentrarchus labrax TaxID=13489 RepID=UPI0021F69166|nr:DNA polymerase III PolC-type-like [Dicentrarchus labrax]XP_051266987.1 DNA polymerase III PolC-type-like [Dicentrarchus labrax]
MSDYMPIVFFDLETTGLDNGCDIIQLSATCGNDVFDVFTVPRCPISKKAAEVTGFTVSYDILFRNETEIDTIPLEEALTSFIEYLGSFGSPVVLAAHNAKRFDARVLTRVLQEFYLEDEFDKVVYEFLDTLLLSRKCFTNLHKHSLMSLALCFLKNSYDAHDALEKAKVLQKLFNIWSRRTEIARSTFKMSKVF